MNKRRRKLLALAGVCLAAGALRSQEPDRVFTLEQSVQTALQNNQSLLSAREDVRIAQQRIVEARSFFLPSVGINLNASSYRADDYAVLPGEFGSTVLLPTEEADNFFSGRAYMRQTIYNGGRSGTNLRLAQAGLEQARIHEEEIRAAVTEKAVKAFYDVLLNRKKWELGESARREIDVLTSRLPAGDELGRAILGGLSARLRRDQAERGREEARATLAFVGALGLELYTRVGVSGELATTPVRQDLAKLLARAQEARLEIRGTEYQREIDRLAVNLSEAARYPVVAFGAGYELSDTQFPLDRGYWNATLNVNLPLFDGFASQSRIRQTRHAANQSRIERAALQDRINREVRESYGDVAFWQGEMVSRLEDRARLEELFVRVGAARPVLERAELRAQLLDAEEAYWESVHSHRVARDQLERAVGLALQ